MVLLRSIRSENLMFETTFSAKPLESPNARTFSFMCLLRLFVTNFLCYPL
jgi:hypothetical protein